MCERSGNTHLALTQEFLAYMLGVQRTSIGKIAHAMKRDGIIRYRRGKIEIIDFERLKASACECFLLIKEEYASFLNEKKPSHKSATRKTRASA